MQVHTRLSRFLKKGHADKVRTVAAKSRLLRHAAIGMLHKATTAHLVAPKVLRSRGRFYAAFRPDSDIEFQLHPELVTLSSKWVAHNFENNAGDLPRLYALSLNIKQAMVEGVEGDFAELGVYRGNSAAVLAHYGREHQRSVYLFDTFSGFETSDLTGVDAEIGRAFTETSLDLVRETVGEEAVIYVRGHFPDSVTTSIARKRFAVVHLDCDLYEPMKAGIEFFFPRLTPGGLLIIHDYSNPYWEGPKRAVNEYLREISENIVLMPDKSGTAILRKSR